MQTDEIEMDLGKVNSKIKNLLSKVGMEGVNWKVGDADYLNPTLDGEELPLEDPKGSFRYFSRIRESLEYALVHGSLPKRMLPPRAPDYLRELAHVSI